MPAKYEHIRDAYLKAGKSEAEAKKLGAMTYNAQRKPGVRPVTGKNEGEKRPGVKRSKG